MKIQFEFQFDKNFESLDDALEYAINSCGWSKNSLAGEMGYSPAGLSKRLNRFPNGNDPRFSLRDLDKFVEVTGNTLPIKYLVKKFLTPKDDEVRELLEDLQKDLPKLKMLCDLLEKRKEWF